ncbi:MAG: 16S rRNA (uracil(1498)-N(3))-methyltransferase, partial [Flavobacteriaceae bacterium]|nr:16S rRNA (uracil(1498)-N(3))-methyltransferase [Flavobacteriaceae bacterium]
MQLFYNSEITESSKTFTLSPDESKHLLKVLRKKKGDHFHVTNGKGWIFTAALDNTDLKKATANVVSSEKR